MKLQRLTERIWIYPFEEERDRPILGYICGNRWSLAVDAGHSASHTEDFYKALLENDLPLPAMTVLTHWHWDHTFGMHAVHGLTIANEHTDRFLTAIRQKIEQEGREYFLSQDYKIRNEYAADRPVIISNADVVFSGEMHMNTGNCPIRVFESVAPHTEDSTLVEIPEEKVLFLGDAAYGEFPTWKSDPVKCKKLVETISGINADICIVSHHNIMTKASVIGELNKALSNSPNFE